MSRWLTIDGSYGEGGGQILRSSLALSLVTGRPVVVERIRAGRKKPGLRRQHLTAVRAAAEISQANVKGAELGSQRLEFQPRTVRPGQYEFRIGTAGSATLVLQTILPALMLAEGPSRLTFEGGTHNPWAPPFDFVAQTYLPLVNRMGPDVKVYLERPGFYPAGGGRFRAEVEPAGSLAPLELLQRGKLRHCRARILLANLPEHIAQRERDTLLRRTGWDRSAITIELLRDAPGPGNVVVIEVESEALTEVFVESGRIGLRAEQVARNAWQQTKRYLDSDVPVGEYLADQLLLPLGIGAYQGTGGAFRTFRLTEHARTHIHILRMFLDVRIDVEPLGRDECLVRVWR
ncbi:MAG: RNA 3'-terminal phosphate cyclase [Planctomycetes bacterium]|nr:RNA 3'-terminal phosphate cyclase [Planctomycetota bacterium]